MNSINIASSTNEAQTQIEEELIALIKKDAICTRLRFWEPEERRSDDEILAENENIFFVKVFYTYKKNAKKPSIHLEIGAHNDLLAHTLLNEVVFSLSPETISELKIWSKKAARIVANYFKKNSYFLTEIRFDLVPNNKDLTEFIIPYLPLESISFSKNLHDAKIKKAVSLDEYLNKYISDMNALNDFLTARNFSSNHQD